MPQRQFNTRGRLKGIKGSSLKTFGKTLLAVRAGDIGDPFIIGEEA